MIRSILLLLSLSLLVNVAHAKSELYTLINEMQEQKQISYNILANTQWTKKELRILRNTVYAIHSYGFKSKDLTQFFSTFSWYTADKSATINLTEVDEYNLSLITYIEVDTQIKNMIRKSPVKVLDETSKQLIGMWQDAPSAAAGWGHTYSFFDNGWVWERFPQADCAKRLYARIGTWILEEGILHLEYSHVATIAGGKLIPSQGSCGSEMELVGGSHNLDPLLLSESYFISDFSKDEDLGHPKFTMDEAPYWKMSYDPWDYE